MLLIKTLLSHFASSFVFFHTPPFAFGLESLKHSSKSGLDEEARKKEKKNQWKSEAENFRGGTRKVRKNKVSNNSSAREYRMDKSKR